jgi:hypothetical protein
MGLFGWSLVPEELSSKCSVGKGTTSSSTVAQRVSTRWARPEANGDVEVCLFRFAVVVWRTW